MYKLAIDAGHGANTAGKRCSKALDPAQTREWWLNQRVAGYLADYLSAYHGVEMMRMDDVTGQTDVPISGAKSRQKAANAWGADLYLSIHHNAAGTANSIAGHWGGGGLVAFVYGTGGAAKVGADTIRWRDDIYDALLAAGGVRGDRVTPKAVQDLAVCRETSMPAVLVELGFMDSMVDVPVILTDDFARRQALGLCNAIAARWGLQPKYALGDVNGDGKVDSTDARMVLQYEVGIIDLTPAQLLRADVNGDGVVDSGDARLILEMEVGLR